MRKNDRKMCNSDGKYQKLKIRILKTLKKLINQDGTGVQNKGE